MCLPGPDAPGRCMKDVREQRHTTLQVSPQQWPHTSRPARGRREYDAALTRLASEQPAGKVPRHLPLERVQTADLAIQHSNLDTVTAGAPALQNTNRPMCHARTRAPRDMLPRNAATRSSGGWHLMSPRLPPPPPFLLNSAATPAPTFSSTPLPPDRATAEYAELPLIVFVASCQQCGRARPSYRHLVPPPLHQSRAPSARSVGAAPPIWRSLRSSLSHSLNYISSEVQSSMRV